MNFCRYNRSLRQWRLKQVLLRLQQLSPLLCDAQSVTYCMWLSIPWTAPNYNGCTWRTLILLDWGPLHPTFPQTYNCRLCPANVQLTPSLSEILHDVIKAQPKVPLAHLYLHWGGCNPNALRGPPTSSAPTFHLGQASLERITYQCNKIGWKMTYWYMFGLPLVLFLKNIWLACFLSLFLRLGSFCSLVYSLLNC